MELGKVINHKITIEPTMNKGFYVTVGCGRFSFSNTRDMVIGLTDYLDNPEFWEREYSKLGIQPQPPTTRAQDEIVEERPQGDENERPESA